jgi:regulation of enolase protein 1 (concanavalin A-like superfamily)
MQWLNEPPHWQQVGDRLTVKTAPKTDFWRITHYGFIRDNGHFYFDTVSTDFVMEVKIRGSYRDLYDQAGIMLRVDEKHWIKTGIEYVEGVQNLSAVVTHDYSDWSVIPLTHSPETIQLRVERRNEAIHISHYDEVAGLTMFRLAYLPAETMQVGLMVASPDGDGFEVTFEDYRLDLLDLS